MTAPAVIRRALTFNFARSVTYPDQRPQTMQVIVQSLATASLPVTNGSATFVDPAGVQEVLLAQPNNPVTFQLVPSNNPNLSTPLTYRAAWRAGGVTGELFTSDFAMPDADISFDELPNLGLIVDAEVYLQQADLGVPGRVARLNDAGDVVDAAGTPVATSADVEALQNSLTAETVTRGAADTRVRADMTLLIDEQFNQAIITSQQNIAALQTSLGNTVNTNSIAIGTIQTTLPHKADLDNTNHIPISEIPPAAITSWIPVTTVSDMLALQYPSQVQIGDIALVGTGPLLYGLAGPNPSQLNNWIALQRVVSVNGKQGDVVLTAADVGAVDAATGHVSMAQVTGLATTLSGLATTEAVAAVADDVTAIQNDTTIVRTSGGTIGTIDDSVLPANIALVNELHQVTDKDGDVVAAGGAVLSVNAITGNVILGPDDVGALAANAAIPQSQITSLPTDLTTIRDDISALQSQVGGTGGAGAPAGATEYWQAASQTTNFSTVTLHSPWGVDSDGTVTGTTGTPYNNPAGARAQDVRYAYITPNGHLQLRRWNEAGPADAVYALASDVTTLQNAMPTKADLVSGTVPLAEIPALPQSQVTGLTTALAQFATKADLVSGTVPLSQLPTIPQSQVSGLTSALGTKADLVSGVIPLGELPSIPQTQVTGLTSTLAVKADLISGTVPLGEIPTIPQSQVSGLGSTLAAKADLVGGVVPANQIPTTVVTLMVQVANKAAMLALTTSQVGPGWLASITATADQGTYMLMGTDPSQAANWMPLSVPLAPVLTVNGQTGTVFLQAADVGALAANASIPISQITNLQNTINSLATTTALTTGLAGKTSPTDVQTILATSTEIIQRVNYVATANIASLSGQQSADGVLMAVGSTVLLTAQSSSIQNGAWTVNSSAWTRTTDMASGAYLVRGTLVVVASGNTRANTLWQVSSASGVVDTNANNWTQVGSVAPPYAPAQGNGINITGTAPAQTFTAVAAAGGGCQVTSSGIALDPAVAARKKVLPVPASNPATLTHNLNTTTLWVSLTQVAGGTGALIGWTATSANTVSLQFDSTPTTGQWNALVIG